jgi:hypothetical protein
VHPRFGLLDWELWGRGPAGTDAATLHCYSLLPATAKKINAMFADALNSPTGRVAQLYVIARMLRRVDDGDYYPDLAEALTRHAHGLLASTPI